MGKYESLCSGKGWGVMIFLTILLKTIALGLIFLAGMVTCMALIIVEGHECPTIVRISKEVVEKSKGHFEDRDQNKKDD